MLEIILLSEKKIISPRILVVSIKQAIKSIYIFINLFTETLIANKNA